MASRLFAKLSRIRSIAPVNLKTSVPRCSAYAYKSYAFFAEIITKGAVDKGGRCPDGTITVARAGNDLALFWFGSIEANTIVAYGTLSKK